MQAAPPSRPCILVTGSNGFLGSHVVPYLQQRGYAVRPVTRQQTGPVGAGTDWQPLLQGVDVVVHLAARAHAPLGLTAAGLEQLEEVNVRGTARLAAQAAAAGVRRLVFISSVKAMAEQSDKPLTPADRPCPADPYGRAKLRAEQALAASAGGMEQVILRPPLVYGAGVKGNFRSLLTWVDREWPLPLGSVRNRRSLICAGNLADAVRAALDGPPGIWLPSDQEDVSLPDLLRRLAVACGRQCRLFPVPPPLLRAVATMTGQGAQARRLLDSLTVDGRMPGWTPPFTLDQGLAATCRG